jgi:small nuclear ribonucleoprotein (snRNP)-like protein
MICNNQLRYPIFDEVNLETYGQIRIAPVSGSTDTPLLINQPLPFPWYTIQSNPANNISEDLIYTLDYPSKLRGILNLECKVEKQSAGNGVPQFDLVILDASDVVVATISLTTFNDFFSDIRDGYISQNLNTETTKYTLQTEFNTTYLPADTYTFAIKYRELGGSNFTVKIDPDNSLKSYLQITKVGNVGEGFVMKLGQNMPFGTRGIKQLDFITAIQKKFNLVIYPSKTQRNQFIVETFNSWARIGKVKSFDGYMNLNQNIEVIPANNLAVNELNFGDTLDRDYISQQFNNLSNREYGKTYYVDTENFFSQGAFTVSTTFASAPLSYLEGTGVSGSQDFALDYLVSVADEFVTTTPSSCPFAPQIDSEIYKIVVSVTDLAGLPTTNFGAPITANIRFTYTSPSFSQTFTIPVSIPFGSSTGEYTYTKSEWNNFFGSECSEETQIPECVVSVENATLSVTSPLTSC